MPDGMPASVLRFCSRSESGAPAAPIYSIVLRRATIPDVQLSFLCLPPERQHGASFHQAAPPFAAPAPCRGATFATSLFSIVMFFPYTSAAEHVYGASTPVIYTALFSLSRRPHGREGSAARPPEHGVSGGFFSLFPPPPRDRRPVAAVALLPRIGRARLFPPPPPRMLSEQPPVYLAYFIFFYYIIFIYIL